MLQRFRTKISKECMTQFQDYAAKRNKERNWKNHAIFFSTSLQVTYTIVAQKIKYASKK
jgi:hypothetical protein